MTRIRATNATIAKRVFALNLVRTCAVSLALATIALCPAAANSAPSDIGPVPAASAPWIALSDVHYGPTFGGSEPSVYGEDTNPALLRSLLAELHRVDPNPPVVFIAGDFLAHGNDPRIAARTIADMAKLFDAVYPHAQFLITLGNNDSPCGDYAAPVDDAFLATIARAWAPLVNRRGAAPNFVKSFSHDGSYVATLPVRNVRAVVINDVSFALRFADRCGSGANATNDALEDLTNDLRTSNPDEKNWLLLHVPPGIDAFSTSHLAHRLAIIPFMRPHVREAFDDAIEDPKNKIALIVAGHTHKFAYRVASGSSRVPLLLVPSVSPIFANAPSFLELDVRPDATVGAVREYSYLDHAWKHLGDLNSLGVETFDVPALLELQTRLERESGARSRFSKLYSGGAPPEITEGNWRLYWCAATALTATTYGACDDKEGFSVLTPRALKLAGGAAAAIVAVLVAGFIALRRMRRAPVR